MTDPKDAGVGRRAACDSDRGIQEDQRNLSRGRVRRPFSRFGCQRRSGAAEGPVGVAARNRNVADAQSKAFSDAH
jgi:hypothetical protein